VFGTLKAWMGATHFLTRRFPNVKTEMSLHVHALGYGMRIPAARSNYSARLGYRSIGILHLQATLAWMIEIENLC